jgi:predicted DNA-binding transcriptional regulator AlpA
MDEGRLLISIRDAAIKLGISRFHLYGMTGRNEFPHIHIGRRVVVDIRDIENYIRKNKEASLEK